MNERRNALLTPLAQSLRKKMTKEERHLWYDFLKTLPVTIHRQKTIGDYIVDFYCAKAQLVIELDGSQHYREDCKAADIKREGQLQRLGITVLRYSNADINMRFSSVCQDIWNHIFKEL